MFTYLCFSTDTDGPMTQVTRPGMHYNEDPEFFKISTLGNYDYKKLINYYKVPYDGLETRSLDFRGERGSQSTGDATTELAEYCIYYALHLHCVSSDVQGT